ncbi:MAG: four helix bundle protein [Bacteroidales bacterium]|nr:four helix bundle protein [Bacteroidales bacterium]
MKSYKELLVWQKSMNLVKDIYMNTHSFPKQEDYCLTRQIRRSSISIPSNIAEGFGRRSKKEYINFLAIARGSLYELCTQIGIVTMLNLLSKEQDQILSQKGDEIRKMINALIHSLEKE